MLWGMTESPFKSSDLLISLIAGGATAWATNTLIGSDVFACILGGAVAVIFAVMLLDHRNPGKLL